MCRFLAIVGAVMFAETAIAALTVPPGVTATEVFATGGGDPMVSFDWANDGKLYYITGNYAPQMTVHEWDGTNVSQIYSESVYPGSWVACNGAYAYFTQDSDMVLYKYDTAGGGPATVTAQVPGLWGVLFSGGDAFLVGADAMWQGTIHRSIVGLDGELGAPSLLGTVGDPSGPMAFDAGGNLYYSAGYMHQRILKYTAAEVADAVAGGAPLGDPAGHVWASFAGMGDGATGMAFDADGALVLTATSFLGPSRLLRFTVAGDGSNADVATLADCDTRLGTVRLRDGAIQVNDGDAIYSVVPEPSVLALLAGGVLPALIRRARRREAERKPSRSFAGK